MRSICNHVLVLILCIVALSRCAQIGVPSGGDVDKSPPKIVKSVPENESVNFSGSEVQVTFHEYIVLNDIKNQLIISPPLSIKPKISLKKKTVTIEFQEVLRENTTYSLNFGEGIADYNAGNVLRNFIMAFSTGPELDSLKIRGKIIDAKSTLPKEKVKVMLYDALADSLPLTAKPTYFAQTDASGRFEIKYLSEGAYKLFALEELDGNFFYDSPEENIAYREAPLEVITSSEEMDSLHLFLFNEEQDLGYITKTITDSLKMEKAVFNKIQKEVEVSQMIEGANTPLLNYLSGKGDTLVYFIMDGSDVYISRVDSRFSNSTVLIDTLTPDLYLDAEKIAVNKGLKLSKTGKSRIIKNQPLIFKSSKPIRRLDSTLISVLDSDTVEISGLELKVIDDFSFKLITPLESDNRYTVTFLPDAVQSEYGSLMDTVKFQYSVIELKELGELSFTVNLPMLNPVLILKKTNGEIVKSISIQPSESTVINNLFPMELEVFCLDDANGDGTWTTGNYELGIQPETLMKFPNKIEVRANWSQEFIWE